MWWIVLSLCPPWEGLHVIPVMPHGHQIGPRCMLWTMKFEQKWPVSPLGGSFKSQYVLPMISVLPSASRVTIFHSFLHQPGSQSEDDRLNLQPTYNKHRAWVRNKSLLLWTTEVWVSAITELLQPNMACTNWCNHWGQREIKFREGTNNACCKCYRSSS